MSINGGTFLVSECIATEKPVDGIPHRDGTLTFTFPNDLFLVLQQNDLLSQYPSG